MGFPRGAVVKNSSASAGDIRDMSSIPGSARSPGVGSAAHSSILAWKIPSTEHPGGYCLCGLWLQSMRSQKDSDMTEHTHTSLHKPQSQS